MKKSSFFRILLAIPLFLIACNKSDDIELDFDITFPEDWTHYVFAEEGRVLDAARDAKDPSDTVRESVVIFRSYFPASTLGVYYGTLKPQIAQSPAYDSVIYETDTAINALNFKKLLSHERLMYINSYSHDTSYLGAITARYFVYRNDYGYNLTFVSADTAYSANRVVFDGIMSTFQFKE